MRERGQIRVANSVVSLRAVEAAFSLDLDPDAKLYLLHVVDRPAGVDQIVGWVKPALAELYEEAMDRLAGLVPKNWQRDVTIEREVVTGTPAKEIARFAREKKRT
jgi:nucleotide-binding universal stress UspA family protein